MNRFKVLAATLVIGFVYLAPQAKADVCVPTDPDYDPVLCAAGGSGSGAPGGAGGAAQVPVDGGASLLAAAGIAFAGRKFKAYRKNKKAIA